MGWCSRYRRGNVLENILSQTKDGGIVASCGNAAGIKLNTTVMPFIIRGVKLWGINSVTASIKRRQFLWSEAAKLIDFEILDKSKIKLDNVYAVASDRSVGQYINFKGTDIKIISIENALENKIDIAIFSAGKELSLKWAPIFVKKGAYVIDNSSAWRMDETKKLIVPEINGHILDKEDKIIPNPNCSTIQMVMAIHNIHRKYNILRIIVS